MFPELVVEWKSDNPNSDINILDDILLLTSLAARQNCICLRWDQYTSNSHVKYYKRDKTIFNDTTVHNNNTILISSNKFEDYIKTTYKTFIDFSEDEQAYIRQAIHIIKFMYYNNEYDIEITFLKLFSAFETLITFFRKKYDKSTVIPEKEWNKLIGKKGKLKNNIRKFLNEEEGFKEDENKEKRTLIYQKLRELNRISLKEAFIEFCKEYKVNFDYLWPVCDKKDGISLSEIRNKLIHGEKFDTAYAISISIANTHLQYTIENMLLAILGWPTRGMQMEEWKKYRQIFTDKDKK